MTRCPVCEKGVLERGRVKERMFGVELGEFEAEICPRCGESFVSSAAMAQIKARAIQKGIWGLGRRVRISKIGNSYVVRIPKPLVDFLGIRAGTEAFVHPEDHKIVVET